MSVGDLAQSLGVGELKVRSDLDRVRAVSRGLPTAAVDAAVRSGTLSADEADALIISRSALAEREREGRSLTPDDSEQLVGIARIVLIAREEFGEAEPAARWLRKPNRALGRAVPLDLLRTGEGGRIVEDSIIRLSHGVSPERLPPIHRLLD
jgi:putative toxin-antitoxin system antitoxin component (TIGR02293 family)